MGKNQLKFLGFRPSPYANRVQFALNLKSLDYEFVQENFPDKSELLLKSNPINKKIPVLIHGDTPICESQIIIEYIDEVWSDGPSILPSDPYERANARFWAAYLDLKWYFSDPARKELGAAKDEESKAAEREKIMEGLILMEDVYVKSSKGKAFFGGDEIGYLDIIFGSFLGWLKVTEVLENTKFLDETKTPGLVAWAPQFLSHQSVKNVVLDTEQLLDVFNKFQARLAAASSSN